jgi:hypothetical protein
MFRAHLESVGLDAGARYRGDARLRPVVPLDAAVHGVFIVDAFPSASLYAA